MLATATSSPAITEEVMPNEDVNDNDNNTNLLLLRGAKPATIDYIGNKNKNSGVPSFLQSDVDTRIGKV